MSGLPGRYTIEMIHRAADMDADVKGVMCANDVAAMQGAGPRMMARPEMWLVTKIIRELDDYVVYEGGT